MRLIERQKNIEQDKNIKEENIEQLWLFRNISFNIHTFLYHFISEDILLLNVFKLLCIVRIIKMRNYSVMNIMFYLMVKLVCFFYLCL